MSESLDFAALPEDEGYIYFDSQGLAHTAVELEVTWTMAPDKVIHVTMDKACSVCSDEIEYLPIKIAECLERYSLFEGLNCLTAFNITRSTGAPLPTVSATQSGEVGRVVRNGEQLVCEITAQDLWLSIRLNCSTACLQLTFEIKVSRSSTVKQFRSIIFAYALEILTIREKDTNYRLDHLQLSKNFSEFRRLSASSPRVLQCQSDAAMVPLADEETIGRVFDFVSCYVVGTLSQGDSKSRRKSIAVHRDTSRQKPDEIMKSTLAVRKVRIEETAPSEQRHPASHAEVRCMGCCAF